MIFDETTGKLIGGTILTVVAGGGYNLGRRMGLWTSRRRVFFFFWASAAAPVLFMAVDIEVEGKDWIVAAVVFVLTMLTGGPAGAYFMSIYFWFLTQMYAQFPVMADPPCSDRDSGYSSSRGCGIHRLYG